MGKGRQSENNDNKYEKIISFLRKKWFFAILVFLATGIIALSNVGSAIKTVSTWFSPKITMDVKVIDKGVDCGSGIMKKSTLDVFINNNSDQNICLISVTLIPEWIYASFFAGEEPIAAEYTVSLASWYNFFTQAMADPESRASLQKAGKIKMKDDHVAWVKPDPINVKSISDRRFVVPKHEPERFQIHLGLARTIDYLYGTVRLEIKTDSGVTLTSKRLSISVCATDSGQTKN